MKYLYLVLNFGSLLIPFIFSFHPRLKFYNYWKAMFLGIIISMIIFIPWDVIFTINKIWGFNDNYFVGIKAISLPIEEWLFFLCIPYACLFTHYALLKLMPNIGLHAKTTAIITHILIIAFIVIAIIFHKRWYTFINLSYAAVLLLVIYRLNAEILNTYYLTFLLILIPFFFVNGILTGSLIDSEVVWYNNSENLNFRIFTIPIEDFIYAFSLILTNLALTHNFYKKLTQIKHQ